MRRNPVRRRTASRPRDGLHLMAGLDNREAARQTERNAKFLATQTTGERRDDRPIKASQRQRHAGRVTKPKERQQ